MKNILTASLICSNPINIEQDLNQLIKGGIDSIHFDVMDGNFVPRYGLYPEILTEIRKHTDVFVDVHMMVNNPEDYIELYAKCKANLYCFHLESTKHAHRLISKIKSNGMLVGVALNPSTNVDALEYIINDIDMVCLMAINPGIVGSKLIPTIYQKIKDLKELAIRKNKTDLLIEIDGGVTIDNINDLIYHGANMLVCGSGTIFRPHEDTIENKIQLIKKHINE